MQVGGTAETDTVQGGAALIQTETGAISSEHDKKKFLDRPMVDVYPSPLALMTTMPGIQGNGWNLVMSGIRLALITRGKKAKRKQPVEPRTRREGSGHH